MIRIWKDIKGYENKYKISNYGEVISLPRFKKIIVSFKKFLQKKISQYINKNNGYVYVYLCNNGKYKNVRLHKIVAENFIDNPNNYTQINHIEGDKNE